MTIVRQTRIYDGPGGPFEGLVAWDDEGETPRPGVMIVPNVSGRKGGTLRSARRTRWRGWPAG